MPFARADVDIVLWVQFGKDVKHQIQIPIAEISEPGVSNQWGIHVVTTVSFFHAMSRFS
jgi:hypothetical protein